MGLETLHQIRQSSGHAFVVGARSYFPDAGERFQALLTEIPVWRRTCCPGLLHLERTREQEHVSNHSTEAPAIWFATERRYSNLVKIASR